MSTQHDGTALTRLYAQLRDNYDELLTERDEAREEADHLFQQAIASELRADRLEYDLAACGAERDRLEEEADRLRAAIEQHRRDILGPNLQGIPCNEDVTLWETTVDTEDGDER